MSAFAPLSEAQFQQLAMGKARGFTWTMMADQLSLPLEIVERVPWTHEKLWNRHLSKAERLIAREAIAETVSTLRRDVRNAEPNLHATLANSLTRLLQLQQNYAPQRRPRLAPAPVGPTAMPVPVTPVTSPSPTPTKEPLLGALPSLSGTVAALLGFFLLVGTLFVGCWNSAQRVAGRMEAVANEAVATLVVVPHEAELEAVGTMAHVVLTPPPWVREPCGSGHDGT